PSWWGRFFLAWMVCLIPFFIVNGVLTSLPVVWYNNAQNLGIRLGTIPIEDSMYLMLMLSLIMLVYEPLKKRQTHLTPTPA
ncbi:MAG: lycopene cyclase domain-containing protein, partial [Bacteroidetes bacterium]